MAEVSIIIRARDMTQQAISSAKSGFKGLADSVKGMSLSNVAALGGLTFALSGTIKAFGAQEQAVARLQTVMQNVKTAGEGATQMLIEQATALQKVTKYGDEQIISAAALLGTFQLNEKQISQIIPRLLDMAAAQERSSGSAADLEQIALALGKALSGHPGILARYGVVLDETMVKTEGFNGILKSLDNNFKGLATAVAQTGTGAMKQFANVLDDTKEEIGKVIVDAIVPLVNSLKQALLWFNDLPTSIKKLSIELGIAALAMKGLGISVAGLASAIGPAGWLVAGLGLVVGGLYSMAQAVQAQRQATSEWQAFLQNLATMTIPQVVEMQKELQRQLAQTNDIAEQMKIQEKLDEINRLMPSIIEKYKEQNEAIDLSNKTLEINVGLHERNIQLTQEELMAVAQVEASKTEMYRKAYEEYLSMREEYLTEAMERDYEREIENQQAIVNEQMRMQEEYLALREEMYLTDEQREIQSLANRLAKVKEYWWENKELAEIFEKQSKKIHDKYTQQQRIMYAVRLGIIADSFGMLADATESILGRQTGVVKAFLIIQAIMDTYAGMNRALGYYPPPYSFIMAAAVAVKGFANVNAIMSQQHGGIVYAQGGTLARGTDVVPAMLTPGEAVIPRQTVRQNPEVVQQLLSGQNATPVQTVINIATSINVSAIDSESVDQFVKDGRFASALVEAINDRRIRLAVENNIVKGEI